MLSIVNSIYPPVDYISLPDLTRKFTSEFFHKPLLTLDYSTCSGDISMIHVNANELQLCQTFNGAHSEIVRSICWNPQVSEFLNN
jgi:hypothetical protein